MTWTKPEYAPEEVKAAGELLRRADVSIVPTPEELSWARAVLNNWKAAHNYPLNALRTNLVNHANAVIGKKEPLTAQRIKRVPSILAKLRKSSNISLLSMQDLGGCRAIVDTVAQVNALRDRHVKSRARHRLSWERDYLKNPKASGYRSIHLIYEYVGRKPYKGMLIEVQLRTRLQHQWATANEVMGMLRGEMFKSGKGDPKWLLMFTLLGAAFALMEGTTPLAGVPNNMEELQRAIRDLDKELLFSDSLGGFQHSLRLITEAPPATPPAIEDAHYFLLTLYPGKQRLSVVPYPLKDVLRAERDLAEAERALGPEADVVLVAAPDVRALKRAYPNYWLDTRMFLQNLNKLVG